MSGPPVLDRRTHDAPHQGPPAGPGVDPRFRERRIAVRKDAGRRRLKRLLLLAGAAAVALAGVLVLRSPVLDVDEITVAGAAHLAPEAIREASGVDEGAPILLADTGRAVAGVEALPWVASAEITRDLPGRIHIEVREREPVAVVSSGDGAALVDVDGRVLEATDGAATPFVQVVAPDAPPAPGRTVDPALVTAIELAGRLRVNPAGAVAAVHVRGGLRLELAGGGEVDLGDASELDAKVEAFRTVHARVDRDCLATIDLRVPTHPVVTRDRGC